MSYPSYTKSVMCYIEAHITDEKINHDKLARQIGIHGSIYEICSVMIQATP